MFSCLVQKLIKDFLQKDNTSKIVKDVCVFVYQRSGIKIPIQLTRRFMKQEPWLTYKIGISRPDLFNEQKHLIIKAYFAVRIAKLLLYIDIVVNVDEACFSHYLMKNRSWFRKGHDQIVTNKRFLDSVSLISCIASTGWSFNATVTGTINHKMLIEYLTHFINFLTT